MRMQAKTSSHVDEIYNGLVRDILEFGDVKTSRGGAISPTIDLFGPQVVFDLREGFPLLSSKKVYFKSIYHELMALLRGETKASRFKTRIWDKWADSEGNLGRIYGAQWRQWRGMGSRGFPTHVDQVRELLEMMKDQPDSRRLIVTAWNPAELDQMRLPPCHCFFQLSISGPTNEHLDMKMYQRSADTAIGVPFNIASYALLQMMLARELNLTPRRFIHTFGSAHIYDHHVEKIKEQIQRPLRDMPKLIFETDKTFFQMIEDDDRRDVTLLGYTPHEAIEYEVDV